MAVVTPCYAPDRELCRELHQSVLDLTPPSTVHYLIVPDADMDGFASFAGPRSVIWSYSELLPPRFVPARWINPVLQSLGGLAGSVRVAAINTRRPWPPIRGWILQQALKLAAAPRVDADVAVLVDADVQFIRPVSASTFVRDDRVALYRVEGGVHRGLPEHITWHRVARRLLGLPQQEPPYHDYVCSPNAWDPGVVGALQQRIETVTGRPWIDAVTSQRTFSECTLYGTFVDEFLGSPANQISTNRSKCYNYWDEVPMSAEQASEFAKAAPHDDVAVMISAKSQTPVDIRRSVIAEIQGR